MATITKRGERRWQAKIRKKGYATVSKTFATKAQAERWARLAESQMDRHVFVSTREAEQTLLSDLLERYRVDVVPTKKSLSDMNARLNTLDAELGRFVLTAITPKLVADYRDRRLLDVTADSVRKELSLLGRIVRLAESEWGLHLPRGNPVSSVRQPKPGKARDRRLAEGEEELLTAAAREYGGEIEPLIGLAIETGMRRGELLGILWSDVDLVKRTVRLRDTKNSENRTVPLTTAAVRIMKKLPSHDNGRMFSMKPHSVSQAFRRVTIKAGIPDLRFHDLRHEATSRFFECGLELMEVANITGHKDLAMLRRYTHLRAEDLALKLE